MAEVPKGGNLKIKFPSRAIEFNGNDSYISCGSGNTLNFPSSMTLTTWFYPSGHNSGYNHVIIAKSPGGFGTLEFDDFLYKVRGLIINSNSSLVTTSDIPVSECTWYNFSLRADAKTKKVSIFKNGVKQGEDKDYTGKLKIGSDSFEFSTSSPTSGREALLGKISDTSLYKRALTDTEISEIYTLARYPDSGLISRWKFNLNSYLKDQTNNNSGTFYNTTWSYRDIDTWCSRWSEGNWDVVIESKMTSADRNYLFDNVVPGSVRDITNILGVPLTLDTTYSSGNTLIFEPKYGYELSGLREKRTIGVKDISDILVKDNLYSIKINGLRLDT